MERGLVREINSYLKGLQGNRDWQSSKICDVEHDSLAFQKTILPSAANKIVKSIERHWGIMVNQIYPEFKFYYDGYTLSESWPVSSKACAINIPLSFLKPYIIVHEVSHGIAECSRIFHSKGIREPGHGPLWTGIYVYNMNKFLDIDIWDEMRENGVRVAEEETILKLRKYFKP